MSGNVARMEEKITAFMILFFKPDRQVQFGSPVDKQEESVKICFQKQDGETWSVLLYCCSSEWEQASNYSQHGNEISYFTKKQGTY